MSQDIVRYPLTRSQITIAMQEKYSLHKGLLQIPMILRFKRTLDVELMKKAINIEIERNDTLRVKFENDKESSYQYFVPPYDFDGFSYLDFSNKTEDDTLAQLTKLARKPLDYYGGTFGRIVMFTAPDGNSGLLLVLNHLAMDAWGAFTFVHDLLNVYVALDKGTELPRPPHSYEECLKKELLYTEDDAKEDMDFLEQYYSQGEKLEFSHILNYDVTMPDSIKKRAAKPTNAGKAAMNALLHDKSACTTKKLDGEFIGKIKTFCTENRVPFNTFFHFAVRTYLQKINGRDDVMYRNLVHRRATLAEKNSGGCRVGASCLRTVISKDATFKEAIATINETQHTLYKHLGIGAMQVGVLLNRKFNVSEYMNGGALMLTLMPPEFPMPEGYEYVSNWISLGRLCNPLYLLTLPGENGGMSFNYEYRIYETCAEQIDAMHDGIISILEKCMTDPTLTVSQIIESI